LGTGSTAPVAKAEFESKHEQIWREKRRHPRKPVKLVACIRRSGTERIVDCEDLTRGGFSFTSKWSYAVDDEVEAAMPFSRAGGNIFLPARIAHCKERSTGWHKCGVAYERKT
jgi:PilZ domain